jgi:hypothetical protein
MTVAGRRISARVLAAPLLLAAAIVAASLVTSAGDDDLAIPALSTAHDVAAPLEGAKGAALATTSARDVEDAATHSDLVVIGTVTQVRPGPDLGRPGTDDRHPTQFVTVQVRDRWAGSTPEKITIYRSGDDRSWVEGDPPYAAGQDYVLYLVNRKDGPWHRLAAPEGRIQILNGRLRPVADGEFAATWRDRTPAELKKATLGAGR